MSKKVVVYSKPNCKNCILTKNWLTGNDTEFDTVDIMEDKSAIDYIKGLGFLGVPVTVIEGQEPFDGFKPELLNEYLGK